MNFNYDIIIKYLSNSIAPEEEEVLLKWLKESEQNRLHFLNIKQIWTLRIINNYSQPTEIESALKSFHHLAHQNILQKRRQLFVRWSKYAAIFLLIVGIPFFYWLVISPNRLGTTEMLSVNATDRVKIMELPDGSKVWLNNNSTLYYPQEFSRKERNVSIKGEAFFEVKRKDDHPFKVLANNFQIEVLGTSFNVLSYGGNNASEATLVTGSISLLDIKGKKLSNISPGQQAIINKSGDIIAIKQVNTKVYSSWRYGMVKLERKTITEIADTIENVYHVQIIVNGAQLSENRYNFVFKNDQSIDTVLTMLGFVAPIQYKIINNNIFINPK